MLTMRGAPPLVLTEEQRASLEQIARSTALPHRAVRQAKALLWAGEGVPNEEIGRRAGVSSNSVRTWRAKFDERGVDSVEVIAKGRGRRPWSPEGTVTGVVRVTLTHFEEKLVDVVALYSDPPRRAVVFCFDEKTQCQALDRTQPSLPTPPWQLASRGQLCLPDPLATRAT